MSIFSKIMDTVFGKNNEKSGAIPGEMGNLLWKMGIHEIGPHIRSGTPANVLAGCKKEIILIPGATMPAFRKNGEPLMARDKNGREYHVIDNAGISRKQWKSLVNDQKRKAAGRWYSGAGVAA